MATIQVINGDSLSTGKDKINTNFDNVNTEVVTNKNNLTTHKASSDHPSQNITYDGDIVATNVKGALETVNDRISDIIADSGTSSTEVVDARGGFTVLNDRLDNVDLTLSEKVKKNNSVSQISIPIKNGVLTKSPKIVIAGASNDAVTVIQYNGTKYVIYELNTADGDTGIGSVGSSWDLIRIKKATMASNSYVAKTILDGGSTVGTLETFISPALRNSVDDYLIHEMAEEDTNEYLSATSDGFGLGLYSIVGTTAISSITFKVKIGSTKKCNILIYGSTGSSTSADILVNGEIVKSFDPTKLAFNAGNHYKTIEFDIPLRVDITETVDITLRNNDITNKKLYFSCVNFMFLKDYDGRDIDFYKAFGTNSYWLNGSGASDYALFDHDLQKFTGSFHGGETRITAKMTWYPSIFNPPTQWNEGRINSILKSSISPSWVVLSNFEIFQITNINNKGTMLSIFNFDTDGTMDMTFSFYDGSIVVEDFYTALTATQVDLDWLFYPRYEALPTPPQKVYIQKNEGAITQYSPLNNLSLGIRYTRFNSEYITDLKKNGWIQNDAINFKKFYYGYVEDYTTGILVENLTFRKALDFIYD